MTVYKIYRNLLAVTATSDVFCVGIFEIEKEAIRIAEQLNDAQVLIHISDKGFYRVVEVRDMEKKK